MALRFQPYVSPETYLANKKSKERPSFNDRVIDPLLQATQIYAQGRNSQDALARQSKLDQIIFQNKNLDAEAKQRELDYKYGAIPNPEEMFDMGDMASSSFMPGGRGPVGTPMGEAVNRYRAEGYPKGSQYAPLQPYLAEDERKMVFDKNFPKSNTISYQKVEYTDANGKTRIGRFNPQTGRIESDPNDFYAPEANESFISAGVNIEGKPVFYGARSLTPRVAEVPGGGQLYPKNPTEGQQNASVYGQRAFEANNQLKDIVAQGFDTASINSGVQQSGYYPNIARSPESQKFRQLKLNFIAAVLRKESGATIRPEEEKWANEQYFPVTGDSPEVIAQKDMNRNTAIDGLNRIAGPLKGPQEPYSDKNSAPRITATNPQTGERIQSFDGGNTWSPLR